MWKRLEVTSSKKRIKKGNNGVLDPYSARKVKLLKCDHLSTIPHSKVGLTIGPQVPLLVLQLLLLEDLLLQFANIMINDTHENVEDLQGPVIDVEPQTISREIVLRLRIWHHLRLKYRLRVMVGEEGKKLANRSKSENNI